MNQILLTEDINNDKKNGKNSYNEEPSRQKQPKPQKVRNVSTNSNDIKKIIIFFAIIIIVFGLALGAIYGYRLYKNKQNVISGEDANNPVVSLEKDENNPDKVILKIESENGIDKIIYTIDGEENVEEANGKKNIEKEITLPTDIETLEIEVIDTQGHKTTKTESFTSSTSTGSSSKPEIETAIIENGKLKITATSSENNMKYIVYSWNDEDKVTVNAEEESDEIETIIDVKRGKNEITIIAVDSENNQQTTTKTFNGVNTPLIDIIKDNDRITVTVSHDMGIKKIVYDFNNQEYVYDENYAQYDEEKTEVEFYFNLEEGENTMTVTATSSEGTEETVTKTCEYSAEE